MSYSDDSTYACRLSAVTVSFSLQLMQCLMKVPVAIRLTAGWCMMQVWSQMERCAIEPNPACINAYVQTLVQQVRLQLWQHNAPWLHDRGFSVLPSLLSCVCLTHCSMRCKQMSCACTLLGLCTMAVILSLTDFPVVCVPKPFA